ncbi:hypothetical protein JD844_017436 [Phrynosoma platyrhinos]|uniref:EGF-like domain-containing protein n=1 Tax=Phrynosoma platyrhinos TaxID=52577 RepID=A0ABQ7SLV5_PHRPL|nr:hypothetical protein JD844_017436 [Phrynosoma platyrhinos]
MLSKLSFLNCLSFLESLCAKDGPRCLSNSCQKVSECRGGAATATSTAAKEGACHCPDVPLGDITTEDCAQTVSDPCASSPCLHNATCASAAGSLSFTCNCLMGYTGTTCETVISTCDLHFCRHGGTCQKDPDGPTCLCAEGYTGIYCETDLDECLSNPCLNGAICKDRISGYACYCVPGYQGKHCDLEVNECVSDPCLNGATCLNLIGKYNCLCPLEYTGINCELEIDECLSQPCLNGGSCHDSLGGYFCSCPVGFLGDLCAVNTDECASQPCLNGGQCIDDINGSKSLAQVYNFSYAGSHCEIDINECISNPCHHGSECMELSWSNWYGKIPELPSEFSYHTASGYVCHCPSGFTVADCAKINNFISQHNGGLTKHHSGSKNNAFPLQRDIQALLNVTPTTDNEA